MNYMPRLPDDEPRQPCSECRAAVAQLMARIDESRSIQKQHRMRLALLERAVRKLRRQAIAQVVPIDGGQQPD